MEEEEEEEEIQIEGRLGVCWRVRQDTVKQHQWCSGDKSSAVILAQNTHAA